MALELSALLRGHIQSAACAYVLLAALCGACSDGGDALPRAVVSDSAGVRVLTYDLTARTIPTYRVVGEPDLEIGVSDGPPEYTFSSILDLAVTEDGSIIVSDGPSRELRVYDASGEFGGRLGGPGEGPGEFSTGPLIAGLTADTVYAFDNRNGRLTLFTLGGELISDTTYRPGTPSRPRSMTRLNDRTYLAVSPWAGSDDQGPHEMRRVLDSVVVEHVNLVGGPADTLAILPDEFVARMIETPGSGLYRVVQSPTPYSPHAYLSSDGQSAVLGFSGRFAVDIRSSPDGPSTRLQVLGVEHPAGSDEIRSFHESVIREAYGDREVDPTVLRMNLDFLPESLPAFSSFVQSNNGDIWVALPEFGRAVGFEWLVFSSTGDLRGTVRTPVDFQLYWASSEQLVGVRFDDLDIPYVVRYPLLAGEAAGD